MQFKLENIGARNNKIYEVDMEVTIRVSISHFQGIFALKH